MAPHECGDAIDNDGDGLIDAADPSCWGPCQNDESSFSQQIPDVGFGCARECYFDSNGGVADDDCHYSFRCDPNEVPPAYYPNTSEGSLCAYDPQASIPGTALSCAELAAMQSATCAGVCGPIVPNGCDCFGCCELPAGSGSFVWLGSVDDIGAPSCDPTSVLDPARCHPCEPVPSCLNPCSGCEVCFGGGLPPGCSAPSCDGATPCGAAGLPPCPAGSYCITGCCRSLQP